MVAASLVNNPLCGCVESVLTSATQRLPDLRLDLRLAMFASPSPSPPLSSLTIPRARARRLFASLAQSICPLRANRFLSRLVPRPGTTPPRRRPRLLRQILARRRSMRFALQRAQRRPGPAWRGTSAASPRLPQILLCFLPGFRRSRPPIRRRKPHSSSPSLRQSDRDRLLRVSSSVLTFANVVHLFAYKLTCLRAG